MPERVSTPKSSPPTKSAKRTARARIVELTAWLPSQSSPHIKAQNDFWLSNGIVGAEMREDEVLFDVNINDAGIRKEIEVSVRGQKQKVMHSLYFFQFVIGSVTDGSDVPVSPSEVFRPSNLSISNGMPPGGLEGLGGLPRG